MPPRTTRAKTDPARTTPDHQVFEFNLDTAKTEKEFTPFRFMYGGKRWTLAHLGELEVWSMIDADEQARAAGEDTNDVVEMAQTLKIGMGEEQFAEFRKLRLPSWKFAELFKAWQKHSGVELGESDGSTDS
jgi:hypothetical protein